MILTCPDCATSYFVDDGAIPPEGRKVKCSSCGVRWHAEPVHAEPETAAEAEPVQAPEPAEEVPRPPKSPPPQPRKPHNWLLYTGLIAGVILVVAASGAVIFRQNLVNMAPFAAPAFNAVGLKVDGSGLEIAEVTFEPRFEAGRPVLLVKGVVRNLRHEVLVAPPIHVKLLNDEDEVVGGVAARTTNASIPPGAHRYFAITVLDPPAGVEAVEIAFDHDGKADGHGGKKAGRGEAKDAHGPPPGPEPIEAKPLPEGSPDALDAPHAQDAHESH